MMVERWAASQQHRNSRTVSKSICAQRVVSFSAELATSLIRYRDFRMTFFRTMGSMPTTSCLNDGQYAYNIVLNDGQYANSIVFRAGNIS